MKLLAPHELRRELRRVRKEGRISLESIAERSGYHRNSIHYWERRRQLPNLSGAAAWANALGFDLKVTLVPK